MTDIVERLRTEAKWNHGLLSGPCNDLPALASAADEIDRLRRALDMPKASFDAGLIHGSIHDEATGLWPLADFFAFTPIRPHA